jgi:BMFP domain-containing protein YqiC
MIQNDEQLNLVRQQVGRLEDALRSLAVTVRPKSEDQFRVMAEGYVDQLDLLRREIDRYLGIDSMARTGTSG